jgi:hypothetical protein
MTQLAPTFGDHRGADTRVRGVETLVFRSGAGWNPAADWQPASLSFRFIASKPINNRPQDSILPHFGSCRFPIDSEIPGDLRRPETHLDPARTSACATNRVPTTREPVLLQFYSYRKATSGSTREARSAGTRHAASATAISSTETEE